MSIILRRSIQSTGGAWFHLPPYDGKCDIEEDWAASFETVPFRGSFVPYARRHGWRITYTFNLYTTTIALGVQFLDDLREALVDSDGVARVVCFCDFVDTADPAVRKGIYRSCKLSRPLINPAGRAHIDKTFTIELYSQDPAKYTTGNLGDPTVPGEGDYEAVLVDGGEATPYVPSDQLLTMPFAFLGNLEICDADNASRMQRTLKIPNTAGNYNIKGIQIYGDNQLASGDTTVEVSTEAYSGAGSTIAATMASGATNGRTTGTVGELAAGTSFYVFPAAAGGHTDVVGCIEIRSA